jgi:uncharacterized protein YutE (UPF0331/DUF86 family)
MPLDQYLADEDAHAIAERHLQVAAQCLLDIGNHVVAEQSLGTPDDAAGILDVLAAAGAIPGDLHARVRGLAGFRNVLVHDYLAVDQRFVHGLLGRLDDLTELGRVLGEHILKAGS